MEKESLWYVKDLAPSKKIRLARLVQGVRERAQKIVVPGADSEEMLSLIYLLRFDFIENFAVADEIEYVPSRSGSTWFPRYTMSSERYLQRQQLLEQKAAELLPLLKKGSDLETVRAVHDYLIETCAYAQSGGDAYSAIVERKADCKGYTAAFSYLMKKLGLPSGQIIGEALRDGKKVGHTWNVVQMDGSNYFVDVTWDDLDLPDRKGHYAFLGLRLDDMKKSHDGTLSQKMLGPLPAADSRKNNYYRHIGQAASDLLEARRIIARQLSLALDRKGFFAIRCANDKTYRELVQSLDGMISEVAEKQSLEAGRCFYTYIPAGRTILIKPEK